ncbi:hypothetical protein HME9302_01229 [Alteripontixanthobacter maritimus]|uniref:Uncharacterized protein n=1 Tax=Alteripontixanthobacter maritimus TaxID=2161824 RepID=A0A369Q6I4_9SPHN|nr:hypothetical protein [Alteripontixanthobacter maritimus]RDC60030.1 hypothetical protein HME9302_01229 [Alteripontixanthobacter maritimus]
MARAALLTIAEGPHGPARGRLRVAGRTVVEQQVAALIDAGCERILLQVDRPDELALNLQHQAERRRVNVVLVPNASQLPGLVQADDIVVVLDDGFLPSGGVIDSGIWDASRMDVLSAGDASSEPADPAANRIDGTLQWAGLMVVPGTLFSQLDMLGDGFAPVPALIRIVRNGNIPVRTLDQRTAPIITDSVVAARHGTLHVKAAIAAVPGPASRFVAEMLRNPLQRIAERADRAPLVLAGLGWALAALAVLCAFQLLPLVGMTLLSAGVLVLGAANLISAIRGRAMPPRTRIVITIVLDLTGTVLLALALSAAVPMLFAVFVAVATFALVRTAAAEPGRFGSIFADKGVLPLALTSGGILGSWVTAAALMAGLATVTIALSRWAVFTNHGLTKLR